MDTNRFTRIDPTTIDEGMAVARHIGGKHADLAIGDLARRARVLAGNPARRLALLQEAGLINGKNRRLVSKHFQRVLAYDITQRIGVPPAGCRALEGVVGKGSVLAVRWEAMLSIGYANTDDDKQDFSSSRGSGPKRHWHYKRHYKSDRMAPAEAGAI